MTIWRERALPASSESRITLWTFKASLFRSPLQKVRNAILTEISCAYLNIELVQSVQERGTKIKIPCLKC